MHLWDDETFLQIPPVCQIENQRQKIDWKFNFIFDANRLSEVFLGVCRLSGV